MTPREKELEKENQRLRDQVAGLEKRVKELEGQKAPSKSHQQAEAVAELLKAGPVSKEQLVKINPKYPSDAVYYARTILKIDVKTVRTASGVVYMTAEQHRVWEEGQEREKREKSAEQLAAAAASLPKEAVHQTQASA